MFDAFELDLEIFARVGTRVLEHGRIDGQAAERTVVASKLSVSMVRQTCIFTFDFSLKFAQTLTGK